MRGNDDSGKTDLTKQQVGEGNFRHLLRYRAVQCGDTNSEEQLKSAPRNVCDTSGDIQNQIIEGVGAELRQTVVSHVKKAGFYMIMADETTDITATEHLSLLVILRPRSEKGLRRLRLLPGCFRQRISFKYQS